MWQKPNLLNR